MNLKLSNGSEIVKRTIYTTALILKKTRNVYIKKHEYVILVALCVYFNSKYITTSEAINITLL